MKSFRVREIKSDSPTNLKLVLVGQPGKDTIHRKTFLDSYSAPHLVVERTEELDMKQSTWSRSLAVHGVEVLQPRMVEDSLVGHW